MLLSRLVKAQEEERQRIASDLHDDSIQKVAAAFMRLDMLKEAHPELAGEESFLKARTTLARSIESMRHLMFELRPYVLDRDGLVAALRLYLQEESELEGSPSYHLESRLWKPAVGPRCSQRRRPRSPLADPLLSFGRVVLPD